MHEVRKGLTFPTDFSENLTMERSYPKMYQSHKILRLRSEMSLFKTSLIPFRVNYQSCPYFNIAVEHLSCIDDFPRFSH